MKYVCVGQILKRILKHKPNGSELACFNYWLSCGPKYHPTNREIARETGLSEQAVGRAFKGLQKKLVLEKLKMTSYGSYWYDLTPIFKCLVLKAPEMINYLWCNRDENGKFMIRPKEKNYDEEIKALLGEDAYAQYVALNEKIAKEEQERFNQSNRWAKRSGAQ